jgi:putative nucleotidyltransferase with HDIG domain
MLYEGAKDERLSLAARHGRRARAFFGLLAFVTFGLLSWKPGGPSYVAALALSVAWLAAGLTLGVFFKRLERRGLLMRGLMLAYAGDMAYFGALTWALGGAEWVAVIGLLLTQITAAFYLPPRGARPVAWTSVAALAAIQGLLWLAPVPADAPFHSPFRGLGPWAGSVFALAFMAVLGLVAVAVRRFGHEITRHEDGLRQALGRLKSLNQALSDQQFNLMVSQQDLMLTNERLKQKAEEVLKSQDVIRTLAQALEARDHYTQGHSDRVSDVAVTLARELGMSREEQETLRHGCLLHDIGKIHVPDAVLRKPSALTEDEFELMRKHPVIGEAICRPLVFARPFLDVIRHHHERWDGRGYPDGLKGEEISLPSRIAAIADAWDAMTSDRPYRTALPMLVAFSRMEEGAGTQWDPELVKQFLRVMRRRVEGHQEESHIPAP